MKHMLLLYSLLISAWLPAQNITNTDRTNRPENRDATISEDAGPTATTLENCCMLARRNYPQIKEHKMIEDAARLDITNARLAWAPGLNISGKATWQNVVVEMPFDIPGFEFDLPHDQYTLSAELNQPLWDGGAARSQMRLARAGADVDRSQLDEYQFNWRHGLILLDVLVTLIILMVGLIELGWGYKELCGLFIIMSAVAAIIDGWSANKYCDEMLAGAKGVLWGCILTGLAKGIVVIMQDAMIMDTVIYFLSNLLQGAPTFISAQLMLVVQTLINFIIPSGSGQAAATMPIMAPLADSLGLSRQVACLAFQFGDGLSNLLWPTCSIVIVCGLGDVRYDRWLKWFGKLFACLVVAQVILLQIAVMTGM